VTFNHQKCGIKAGFKKVLRVSIRLFCFTHLTRERERKREKNREKVGKRETHRRRERERRERGEQPREKRLFVCARVCMRETKRFNSETLR
jgi:hypothetical protein